MFRLDAGQVYRAEALEQLPWLEHGFGTRSSPNWPGASDLATLRQIHSNQVVLAESAGDLGEGDALISNVPGVTLVVRTADCLPILIADPRNRAIAAVHAGWRGTVLEIVGATMGAMTSRFGTRQDELVFAIGPGIGPCCYQVGPEVAERFAPFFPERQDLSGATKVGLAETVIRQLRRPGGTMGQIDPSGLCTCCLPDLFYSYRRDGEAAGRMLSTIRIR
ncbi:MAG: peptidoglycan editing factor PgeF [Acidobacteriia bacterium]|nr:peptidoglycan editing factor PgeF [Terriglobia bacterium]